MALVGHLGSLKSICSLSKVSEQDLDVAKCIKKFEFHPSIISIKRHVKVEVMFEYLPITEEEMEKQIAALDSKKNGGCIPTKLLKEMCHIVKKTH